MFISQNENAQFGFNATGNCFLIPLNRSLWFFANHYLSLHYTCISRIQRKKSQGEREESVWRLPTNASRRPSERIRKPSADGSVRVSSVSRDLSYKTPSHSLLAVACEHATYLHVWNDFTDVPDANAVWRCAWFMRNSRPISLVVIFIDIWNLFLSCWWRYQIMKMWSYFLAALSFLKHFFKCCILHLFRGSYTWEDGKFRFIMQAFPATKNKIFQKIASLRPFICCPRVNLFSRGVAL